MNQVDKVEIYIKTSGLVWGAVLVFSNGEEVELSGRGDKTQFRAAVIGMPEALRHLQAPHQVTVYSDLEYLVDGAQALLFPRERLLKDTSSHPANRDRWKELAVVASEHFVSWQYKQEDESSYLRQAGRLARDNRRW